MEGKSHQSVTVSAMSCFLVGLGEEGAGENSFPPSPRSLSSASHYGRWRDREKCPFCRRGREEGAGVSPGQHRRARNGSAVALPQGTIDSNLSTGQGRDPRWVGSFFGSGSSGYFKGHRPEHTLFHSLSLWRMICTYEYHRPVGTWIGVKSIAALIYNANVHSRGKTKMKWMAGNECTPRSPSQFFFPRGESFGNYTAKTVGRTSRVHYITCVNCATGAGRANDRAVGRNYCPGLGAGEIAVQEVAVTKSKQCSDRYHAQSCSVPFFLLPLGRPFASVFPHHQSRSPFLRLAQVYQVQDSPSTKTKIQVTSFSANFRGAIQPSKRTFAQTAVAEKTGRSLHRPTSDVAVVVFALPAGGKLCTCQLHCNGHILMMPKRGARGSISPVPIRTTPTPNGDST